MGILPRLSHLSHTHRGPPAKIPIRVLRRIDACFLGIEVGYLSRKIEMSLSGPADHHRGVLFDLCSSDQPFSLSTAHRLAEACSRAGYDMHRIILSIDSAE